MAKKQMSPADIEAQTALELPDRQTMCPAYLLKIFDASTNTEFEQEAESEQEAENECENYAVLNNWQINIASDNNDQNLQQNNTCKIFQLNQQKLYQKLSWW